MTRPEPCLPVVSLLCGSIHDLAKGAQRLTEHWPETNTLAPGFLFDESDYYDDEMGTPLFRWWSYRDTLANPSKLTDWKLTCEDIEDDLRDENGNRTVNLDPGYLNYGIIVLASHKHHHQKIYLDEGIYADPVLEYVDGGYRPFHWSFPDFQDERYYQSFEKIRSIYRHKRTG